MRHDVDPIVKEDIGAALPGRKRGRPSVDEVAFISAQILSAARDMFKERPFDEVSIEAIAARAGVKKNTIYKRFPDKRAVLCAVLTEKLSEWAGRDDFVEIPGGCELNLKALARRLVRHAVTSDVQIWSRLVEKAWPGHENLEYRRDVLGYNRVMDRFAQLIDAARDPSAPEAKFVAATLMDILEGWTETAGQAPGVTDQQIVDFAHAAVELVIHGCRLR